MSPIVALNVFPDDHDDEIEAVRRVAEQEGAHFAASTHVVDGGNGAMELARAVVAAGGSIGTEHASGGLSTRTVRLPIRSGVPA